MEFYSVASQLRGTLEPKANQVVLSNGKHLLCYTVSLPQSSRVARASEQVTQKVCWKPLISVLLSVPPMSKAIFCTAPMAFHGSSVVEPCDPCRILGTAVKPLPQPQPVEPCNPHKTPAALLEPYLLRPSCTTPTTP